MPSPQISKREAKAFSLFLHPEVVTKEEAGRLWKRTIGAEENLRYSEAVLRACVAENRAQAAKWRLCFVQNLSLEEQWDAGSQLYEYPSPKHGFTKWWSETRAEHSGYILIDCSPRFTELEWGEQEEKIRGLGDGYERAHEATMAEVSSSLEGIHGEKMLRGLSHWGKTAVVKDSGTYSPFITRTDDFGCCVDLFLRDWRRALTVERKLGVCLVRKFDR